ncbi:uncharacterized protein LOC106176780 [Lingula anatina]|uniref:Uncharacterized protein LOC106176780 n=1 Tax=Lingula anatina TaxID=7574 RepID=A0A1S3JXI4_LINAN|nr:uncharacterized protein LOC106176780 [Lingula anatina]|eukprot:XP_013414759.1 uncharacterized protein LOC106176780 [Lingula anatina]
MRLAVQIGLLLIFGVVVVVIVVIVHDVTEKNKTTGDNMRHRDIFRATNFSRTFNLTLALPQNFRNTIVKTYDRSFDGEVYTPKSTEKREVPIAAYSAMPFLAVAAFIVFLCLKGTTWFKEDLHEPYFTEDTKSHSMHKEMVNWLSDSKPTNTLPPPYKAHTRSKRKEKTKVKPQLGESHLLMQMLLKAEETNFGTSKEVILTRNLLTRDVAVDTRDVGLNSESDYTVSYRQTPRINQKRRFQVDNLFPWVSPNHSHAGCENNAYSLHNCRHHRDHPHQNHGVKHLKPRHADVFHAFQPSVFRGLHCGHATQTLTVQAECHPIPNIRTHSPETAGPKVFLSQPSLTSDISDRSLIHDAHYLSPNQHTTLHFSNNSENNLCVARSAVDRYTSPDDGKERHTSHNDIQDNDRPSIRSSAYLPINVHVPPEDVTSSSESCASHTLSNNDADSGCFTENLARNELTRSSMEPR